MILQALTRLFEDLVQQGKLERPGWSQVKASYALCLDAQGQLEAVTPLLVEVPVGKKLQLRPRTMNLPSPAKRSSNILPNFLWDNCIYFLGVDEKKPERGPNCFQASRKLHHELLDGIDSSTAQAILAFFDSWQPENTRSHPILAEHWQDIAKGCNLLFRVGTVFAQEDPAIQAAWNASYSSSEEGALQQCLVTGKVDIPARIHPVIKGVTGTQPSGGAIVSFNADAFCSYGKTQSLNAPVGKYAAFAYTAALNYLLNDKENVHRIGDTTIVCWAEGAAPQYNLYANLSIFGTSEQAQISDRDLHDALHNLEQGIPCAELGLNADNPFYILGLSPNAARISVRFFYSDSFGALIRHVNAHHRRLEIVGSRYQVTPLWALLKETVNPNSREKSASPVMAGDTARAVFAGTPYPATLLEAVMLRIRATRDITPGQAAIVKAYYLRNESLQCPKEVLTVSLNENSTNIPYTLGRMFAVYEAVQRSANPGINATIRDRYFNAASATPATIFPILDNLCMKHLRKLNVGLRSYYEDQIGKLKDVLAESYPARLSLPEQGSFNLGYYHQKQHRESKKEEA